MLPLYSSGVAVSRGVRLQYAPGSNHVDARSRWNPGSVGCRRRVSIPTPAGAGCNSDLAQYSNTPARNASRSDAGGPSLRAAGFEDEDDDEAPCEHLNPLRGCNSGKALLIGLTRLFCKQQGSSTSTNAERRTRSAW